MTVSPAALATALIAIIGLGFAVGVFVGRIEAIYAKKTDMRKVFLKLEDILLALAANGITVPRSE